MTQSWPPPARQPLGALLRDRAAEFGDRLFLRMDDGSFTFREFDDAVDRFGFGLRALGVEPHEVVGMMLSNCPENLVSWFALNRLGATNAAVNTAFRGPALRDMLVAAGCRTFIVDEAFLSAIAAVAADAPALQRVIVRGDVRAARRLLPGLDVLGWADVPRAGNPATFGAVADRDPAMLLYTSGTTGQSKACALSHRFVVFQAAVATRIMGIRPDDVLYTPFPLFHADATYLTTVPGLLNGCTVAIARKFSVSRFWDDVRRFDATMFDFMGATLTMLWKQPQRPDDSDNPARLAWGIPLPDFASDFEKRFGLRLMDGYGLTEAGIVIFRPENRDVPPGSCGKVLWPYEVALVDDDDEDVGPGVVGEIAIRSELPFTLMNGYYNMPEATAECMRNLWLHTGDLASRDADGFFYFAGRKKDAIRRRGQNISAAEIEAVFLLHDAVLECAAVGVPSELSEEDVKLSVVLRPGQAATADELIEFARPQMAAHMVPRYVDIRPTLPKTPTEKVAKQLLVEEGVPSSVWDAASA